MAKSTKRSTDILYKKRPPATDFEHYYGGLGENVREDIHDPNPDNQHGRPTPPMKDQGNTAR